MSEKPPFALLYQRVPSDARPDRPWVGVVRRKYSTGHIEVLDVNATATKRELFDWFDEVRQTQPWEQRS